MKITYFTVCSKKEEEDLINIINKKNKIVIVNR